MQFNYNDKNFYVFLFHIIDIYTQKHYKNVKNTLTFFEKKYKIL